MKIEMTGRTQVMLNVLHGFTCGNMLMIHKILLSDYQIILCVHLIFVYSEQWCTQASNISRQKVDFHHIVAAILQHVLHFKIHMSPIYYTFIWHNKEDNSAISNNASFATTHRPHRDCFLCYSFIYFKRLCTGIEMVDFNHLISLIAINVYVYCLKVDLTQCQHYVSNYQLSTPLSQPSPGLYSLSYKRCCEYIRKYIYICIYTYIFAHTYVFAYNYYR